METVSGNNAPKQGQDFIDKTADKVLGGVRTAKDTANQAADKLADTAASARQRVSSMVDEAVDQVQPVASRARDASSTATEKVRSSASDVGDSLVSYTKDSPVTALLMATAIGAVLGSLVTILIKIRD